MLCLSAGFMHWKQLLVLLLGCVEGPLHSHTSLFLAALATLTNQLQLGFGHTAAGSNGSSGGSSEPAAAAGGGEGVGAALLGGGLVEELLPDSFLKQAFRCFFEMLEEAGSEAPAQLLAQVGLKDTAVCAACCRFSRLAHLTVLHPEPVVHGVVLRCLS
jgi:hypothetical protein